jgi:hypothetical protein
MVARGHYGLARRPPTRVSRDVITALESYDGVERHFCVAVSYCAAVPGP